jgi:hypothetical protein
MKYALLLLKGNYIYILYIIEENTIIKNIYQY